MKRFIISTICGVMVLSLVACEKGNTNMKMENINENLTQIANPIKECETLQEAESLIGFKANIPTKLPDGYIQDSICVIGDEILQAIYLQGENEICFRQAKGNEDISGDYNDYKEINIINVNELKVTTKGNNTKINLALWIKDNYTFAVSSNISGEGLEENFMIDIIDSINKQSIY